MASREAEEFMREQSARSELGRTAANHMMKTKLGYTWWLTKTRPQCIKCKAKADGIPAEEARKNHMEARIARDVQRANNWKKTIERKEVNWQLTNLNEYQK